MNFWYILKIGLLLKLNHKFIFLFLQRLQNPQIDNIEVSEKYFINQKIYIICYNFVGDFKSRRASKLLTILFYMIRLLFIFEDFLFSYQPGLKKNTINFGTFVTGVKQTSRCLLIPWYNNLDFFALIFFIPPP